MGRKSPTPAVDTLGLFGALWLKFPTLLIDDDEVQTHRLEKT